METLQRTANRGSISTGYDIDNSCKFEDDNDEWLYRVNVVGTDTKTWTVSWWFKQTELRSVNGSATNHWTGGVYGEATRAGVDEYDRLWVDVGGGDGNPGSRFRSLSTAKLRDTAAWYHVVIACDSTQSTEADRLKVWLNGVEVTVWDQHQIPTLNYGSALAGFAGIQMKWGSTDATYEGYSGYLAECNYLDGVTATQNDFGEFDADSGIWKPIQYTGSYGTNGTYLDFADAADLGDDESGNGNDYTLNNITSADQATDTSTNNFATNNPLLPLSTITISEGATKITKTATDWQSSLSNIGVTSGKWYFEIRQDATDGTCFYGVVDEDQMRNLEETYPGATTLSVGYYGNDGKAYINSVAIATYTTWAHIQTMGCALDLDNGEIYFALANTWQGSSDPTDGTNAITLPTGGSGTWFFAATSRFSGQYINCNFGGYTAQTPDSAETDENGYGTFEYAPPTGYYALCTKNLAEFG
jgi:hypothetical protein